MSPEEIEDVDQRELEFPDPVDDVRCSEEVSEEDEDNLGDCSDFVTNVGLP